MADSIVDGVAVGIRWKMPPHWKAARLPESLSGTLPIREEFLVHSATREPVALQWNHRRLRHRLPEVLVGIVVVVIAVAADASFLPKEQGTWLYAASAVVLGTDPSLFT